MKKKIWAVFCAALIICLGVVQSFALFPPSVSEIGLLYGHPSFDAAELIVSIANIQRAVGSFNSLIPRAIIYTGNNVYMLANLSSNGRLITDNGDGTFTFGSASVRSFQISLGTNGFYIINTSYVVTVHISNIIALQPENGFDLVVNPDYVPGSDFQAYSDLSIEWVDYYSALLNYESDLAEAESRGEANGFVDGFEEGRQEGYSDGYTSGVTEGRQEGYETGYSEGLSSGYASGLAHGNAAGLQQGRQEGYETGYYEGYADGDAEGYDRGYAGGLNVGREEGYETGYVDGLEDGYQTGYADGLEAGGGSGGSVETPIAFTVKYANASLEASGVVLYLYWDGSDLSTLIWKEASDLPPGYFFYTTTEYFLPSQIEAPSSIKIPIPAAIVDRWPQFNLGYVTIDQKATFYNATCFLYVDSYDAGYNSGFQDGTNIIDGLGTIATAPVNGLLQALDFEVFGLNVSVVVVGILAVLLAFIAWKFIKKFIPV